MALTLEAPMVMLTAAHLAAERGPNVVHYRVTLDAPGMFKWVVASALTEDDRTVLGHQGGTTGAWEKVRHSPLGADLTDAVASITVGGKEWRRLPLSTLTVARTATLSTTNAVAGDEILITRYDVEAFTYAVANGGAGAGTLFTFGVSQAAWAEFFFDGTNWSLKRAANIP